MTAEQWRDAVEEARRSIANAEREDLTLAA